MKQRLKYLPILIYPFWCFFVLYFFQYSLNLLTFFILMLFIPIIAFISSISFFVLSLQNKLDPRGLVYRNFIFKLLHILPYYLMLFVFVVTSGPQIYDMNLAFDIALIWISILVLITGLHGAAAIISFIKNQKQSKLMIIVLVILGLGQCIFVIDVFAALILLIITLIASRKEKRILKEQQEAP